MTAYLQITYVDVEANAFRTLGGAGWPTLAEARRQFRAVPAVENSDIVLDLLDRDQDIRDDKYISRATAEALMGQSFEEMLARAKESDRLAWLR